jgi:hypothetical protein
VGTDPFDDLRGADPGRALYQRRAGKLKGGCQPEYEKGKGCRLREIVPLIYTPKFRAAGEDGNAVQAQEKEILKSQKKGNALFGFH